MRYARLWLAALWLIFVAVAPLHVAAMNLTTCDHMAMSHAPAHHAPTHDDGAMPCCTVPAIIAPAGEAVWPARAIVCVKRPRLPVRQLTGVTPPADPRPPKKLEA